MKILELIEGEVIQDVPFGKQVDYRLLQTPNFCKFIPISHRAKQNATRDIFFRASAKLNGTADGSFYIRTPEFRDKVITSLKARGFVIEATGFQEGSADPTDPRSVQPSLATGKMPVPSNVTAPVLAAQPGPKPPTPTSPVSSTAPGGPETAADMRNVALTPGLPTAMGRTPGVAPPASVQKDTSTPDMPPRGTA